MKSFFEFFKMMEADGSLPPPPAAQPNNPAPAPAPPATNTQQGPVAPSSPDKTPPSSGISPPVNEPTKEAKDELKNELMPAFEKFFKEKFQPFMNKHTMNKQQAMQLIGAVVQEIAGQVEGLSQSQVRNAAATGTVTTSQEPKSPPTQPQAAG